MTEEPALSVSVCIEMIFEEEPFLDRIDRTAETQADAIEFWGWRDRDLDTIAERAAAVDLEIAAMGAGAPPITDPDNHDDAVERIEESVQAAAEYDCPVLILPPGPTQDAYHRITQFRSIVETLRTVAPVAEQAGVSIALEPLNTIVDHPGSFLETAEEGAAILEAVDSPAVGLLYDCYHQQITEGNVVETLGALGDLIHHVHVAGVPGRHEPSHSELDYDRVLEALERCGYDGFVGCEFSPTGDPVAGVEDITR